MSVKGKRKIWVGPADGANVKPLIVEGLAVGSTILPGSIVERVAGGLQLNSKTGATYTSEALVAVEYGDHVDRDVDTAYQIGENTLAGQARSGEFYNALVAAGVTVAKGTALASAGDGTLVLAGATDQVLFYSDEALTVGGSAELVCVRKA